MALSVPTDPDFLALQAALAGEYSIERELGRGGMGIVYLAREVTLDRPVAIKLLPPALAVRPDLRDRFLREARTAAKLSHPHIVPIFKADEAAGLVYFVMAYVEGETLAQRVRARGAMPASDTARLVREVAWALAYAHARGVVHRDVKPDNILLEAGTGRAMVTDFGIAQLADGAGLTAEGLVMGTAQFMSPEQAAGEPVDGRSDLYALGVVAYYALCGRLPFDGPSVQAVLAQHLTQEAPPVAAEAPGVPRPLGDAVARCLAKSPADRFPSGEALAAAISETTGLTREIPAPVRVWLSKGSELKPMYALWVLFTLPAVATAASYAPALVLAPLAFHFIFSLTETRRLLAAGYDLADLRHGLREYLARRTEELAVDAEKAPSLPARLLRVCTYASLAVFVALSLAVIFDIGSIPFERLDALYGWSFMLTAVGAVLGLVYPGRRVDARQTGSMLQLRLWEGRFGDWMVRLAGFRLDRGRPVAAGHRPTELAIGHAAEVLYEALPRATRRQLAGLPAVVRGLEAEARRMRDRLAELGGLAAAPAGGSGAPSPALAERRAEAARDLERAREEAQHRLAASVAALESIRLDLLRLRAGGGSTAALSAALGAARRIGGSIDRAVDRAADGARQVADVARSPSA